MSIRKFRSSTRGQSELVGSILLISVILIGLGTVLAFGPPSLSDSGGQEPFVEDTLRSVASAGDRVALGTSERESVELQDGTDNPSDYTVDETAGGITVTVAGTQYINANLGALVYELEDGATLAYQGGGVFRASGSTEQVGGETRISSSVVTAPSLRIRDTAGGQPTFSGSFVTLSANNDVSGSVLISESSDTQTYQQQRLSSSEVVRIQIQSQYYEAWYRYFTETLGISESNAAIDDSTNTIEVVYGNGKEFFINPSRHDLLLSDA